MENPNFIVISIKLLEAQIDNCNEEDELLSQNTINVISRECRQLNTMPDIVQQYVLRMISHLHEKLKECCREFLHRFNDEEPTCELARSKLDHVFRVYQTARECVYRRDLNISYDDVLSCLAGLKTLARDSISFEKCDDFNNYVDDMILFIKKE